MVNFGAKSFWIRVALEDELCGPRQLAVKKFRNVFGYCVTGIRMQILFTAFPYFTQLVALFYSARNYLEGLC